MSIGVAAPITGAASSIGVQQLHWAQFAVTQWNKAVAKPKFKIVQGDTQLPECRRGDQGGEDARVGQARLGGRRTRREPGGPGLLASYKAGGLAFISGSATRRRLPTAAGAATSSASCRTTASRARRSAKYIVNTLKSKNVYIIDDQETYSQGLADSVQAYLKAAGVTRHRDSISQQASDFSSAIAKIPGDTQIVYIPWQLSAAGSGLRAAAEGGRQEREAVRLGRPLRSVDVQDRGSYDSFFPVDPKSKQTCAAFAKAHGGDGRLLRRPAAARGGVAMLRGPAGVRGRQDHARRGPQGRRDDEDPEGAVDPRADRSLHGERRPQGRQVRHLPDPEQRLLQADRLTTASAATACGPHRGPHAVVRM